MRRMLGWLALIPLVMLACGKSASRADAPGTTGGSGGVAAGAAGDASTSGRGGSSPGASGTNNGGASGSAGSAMSGTAGSAVAGEGSGGSGAAGATAGVGGTSGAGAGGNGGVAADGASGGDAGEGGAPDPGCSSGSGTTCCETVEVQEDATYTLVGWSQDTTYLALTRMGPGDRCTVAVMHRRDTDLFELELPEGWGIDEILDGPCDEMQSAPRRRAIGALGFWDHSPPGSCAYHFDFTLCFLDELGYDSVRFKGEGLSLPGYGPEDQCS